MGSWKLDEGENGGKMGSRSRRSRRDRLQTERKRQPATVVLLGKKSKERA